MINPKPCKCNPTNNRQMEANKKKSKNLLIIKNRTKHVLKEHKHAETKITKQQKTDKNAHAQQTNNNMVNQKPRLTQQKSLFKLKAQTFKKKTKSDQNSRRKQKVYSIG